MDFMRKARGAISLFLVIIMLPMMTLAGVFLDMSRTKIAQEVVTSSADLSLNTVMSKYDKNLKDYFGLLASCQNSNDVIQVSKEYFVSNMVSAGVSAAAAQEYVSNIIDAFAGDEDIVDMLQISLEGEVGITPTEKGAMDNPAMVKKGIVEFMKYRTPVNGTIELFNKIVESDVSEKVKDISKEAELTEAKKDFYEKEDALMEQAEIAYKAIKKYRDFKTSTGNKIGEEDFLHSFSEFFNNPNGDDKTWETVYKEAHQKMVKNLYNTHNGDETWSISLIKRRYISSPGTIRTYSSDREATAANIESLLKSFNTALKNYKTAESELNTAWETVGRKLSTDYGIQYWVALTKTCSSKYSTYTSNAGTLWKAAKKLENAIDYAAEDAMSTKIKKSDVQNGNVTYGTTDEDGKLTLTSLCNSFLNYYNNNFKSAVTGGGSSAFKNIGNQIDAVNTNSNNNLLKTSSVNNIYTIRRKLNNFNTDFGTAYEYAKTAKDETYELKNKLDAYLEAFKAWKEAASDPELTSSELAGDDKVLIQELEDAGVEKFSKQSVLDLTDRLDNIYTLFKTMSQDVQGIKYKSTKVINITNFSKFRNAASLQTNKIVRTENTLNTYAGNSFSFSISTNLERIEIWDNRTSENLIVSGSYKITDSYHPNIEKTYFELYDWMKETFDGAIRTTDSETTVLTGEVKDEDSAEDAKGTISASGDDVSEVNTEENTTGHNFSEWASWAGTTLPSQGENQPEERTLADILSSATTYVTDLFSNFPKTVSGSLVNIRDDLYAMDYIFGMFTYDTFEYEGCYKTLSPEVQKKLKTSEATTKYNDVLKNWQGVEEGLGSSYYKTLTLTPRNAANNWAYGGEVEYILYGNNTNAVNKATAYANIYLIRYVFDLPAVFNYYWEDQLLGALALALEVFAYIPQGLTKTLACLAITAAEAAVDVNTLRLGMPVMLIKIEEDDLVCNYQSVFNGKSESPTDITDKITLQYSDYLKIFLYVKLVGYSENQIYLRTADVIQANMALATDDTDYVLSKAQVYYDFNATVQLAPMWTRLLAVDNLGDLSSAKGWRTITINMTRGY